MDTVQQSGPMFDRGHVGERIPAALFSPKKRGEKSPSEPRVVEASGRRNQGIAGNDRRDGGPAVGGIGGHGVAVVQEAPSTFYRDALKVLATPFVFIGGTIIGVICGVVGGMVAGALIFKNGIDYCACSPCTTIALAPFIALGYVCIMLSFGLSKGLEIGFISGGYLFCDGMWNGRPIFYREGQCCNIPLLISFNRACGFTDLIPAA